MSNTIRINGKDSDLEALRQATEALNEEARLNWDNDAWRKDQAKIMTETIYEGFDHENIISMLSEVYNLGWQDRATVSEVRGLKAFWVARGGWIDESQLKEDVFEVPREKIGFHVSAYEQKLEANFAATSRALIDLGIQRMDAEINRWFFSLIQNAIGPGDANYHAAGGLSLETVNNALSSVRDASKSREVAIVGRSGMTEQFVYNLLGSNGGNGTGFIPNLNEDMVRRGVLGTYFGAPIVSLTNYVDTDDEPFLPANELYVVARDASRTFFWGGMRTREWVEEANDYWHFKATKEVGSVVHRPERIHRIVDTNI
jgi:hypothetical protein